MDSEEEATLAWESIDFLTKKNLKKDILRMFEDDECTLDDISEKINIPKPVIEMAVVELIDEGNLSEGEVESGEIMAISRRINKKLERLDSMEKRLEKLNRSLDILGEGFIKILNQLDFLVENSLKRWQWEQSIGSTGNIGDGFSRTNEEVDNFIGNLIGDIISQTIEESTEDSIEEIEETEVVNDDNA